MTFFVTGATGFIGRHLCAHLTASGQPVLALMRAPTRLAAFRDQVTALGGQGTLINAVPGDLDQPGLTAADLPPLRAVIHLGARFAWRMDAAVARRTNVDGSLAVTALAHQAGCRLVYVSGFMLANAGHLQRLGIDTTAPAQTDWPRLYRRAGAYEASKLEAALRVRDAASAQAQDWVEVLPATVAGHSTSGDLDSAQPLYTLIDNLASGRLMSVPGSPAHWLPLVPVDTLAQVLAAAAQAPSPPPRLLTLDPATPNLHGMLAQLAVTLGRRAPRRHVPLPVLAALLRLPGLPALLRTAPEALHFIQPTRFDTSVTQHFMAASGIVSAPIEQVLRANAQQYLRTRAA